MSKQQLPQLPPMPPMPQTPLTGSCQCGALRYRITETPLTLYCCHCSECQAQASSAFGMSLRIPASGIELLGEYGSFVRDPGKSNAVEGVFCTDCGSRVVHRGRGEDGSSSVKAGTLDDKSWLSPVGHIWVASAQPWIQLDGLIYQQQPDDDYAALIEAFRDQQAAAKTTP